MSVLNLNLADSNATEQLGAELGDLFRDGAVVFLKGTLGAGKTTLTRGLLRSLGYQGAVKSPTYTLVEPYDIADRAIYHFDLYRLSDPEELEYMGIRDYFSDRHLCIIEWPERGQGFLPRADLELTLVVSGNARIAQIEARTQKGDQAKKQLGRPED